MSAGPLGSKGLLRVALGLVVGMALIAANAAWRVHDIHPLWGAIAAFGWSRAAPSRGAIVALALLGLFEDAISGHGWGLMAAANLAAYFVGSRVDVDDFHAPVNWAGGALLTLCTGALTFFGLRILFTGEWAAPGAIGVDLLASIVLAWPALRLVFWVGMKQR